MRPLIHCTPIVIAALFLAGCPKAAPSAAVDPYAHGERDASVPERPEQIAFEEYNFVPPKAADFQHEADGIPVFIAPTHEFPLVELTFSFKGGRYLEPDGKWGVASATSELVHHGGAGDLGPEETDERFAFLAANVGVSVGSEQSSVSLNCLKDNLPEALGLVMDMMKQPQLDPEKMALYQRKRVDEMKTRNDDASNIVAREWAALMWGRDHYLGRVPTAEMVEGLTQEDVAAFHTQIFNPANLVISVTGDVEPDEILPVLNKHLKGWERGEENGAPPAPTAELGPGLYHVQKDIPQGKVRIGMRGITRDDEDRIAIDVMNQILGGGGFTSRLMQRIRSDEGLAYGARSRFSAPVYFPGQFQASFDSKNPTVARATDIVFEEVKRIATEAVSDKDLELAKTNYIETFPRRFETRASTVGTFVDDRMTGRPEDHWDTYRARVEAVTVEDVQRVAQRMLNPDDLAILIVGDWGPIQKGDHEGKANMLPYGEPTSLPMRDPLTQEPI